MGWLGRLLGIRDPFEARLEESAYACNLIRGLSSGQARKIARQGLEMAIQICKEREEYGLQPNPRWLFDAAAQSPNARTYMDALRRDGAHDRDIEEWHSIPYLERAMMESENLAEALAFVMRRLDEGRSLEEAAAEVPRWFPIYGRPYEAPDRPEPDRPIQAELLPRINRWRVAAFVRDADAFKARIESASSFNALVREAIASEEI